MVLLQAIRSRYETTYFVNNPNKQEDITILLERKHSNALPFFSIVVPVHNQETIIADNLQSILKATTEKPYELIVICDACSDRTEQTIVDWYRFIQLEKYALFVNFLVLSSKTPLFETCADNLGFFCARGKYLLEIQADMNISDVGYNMRLLQPFLLDSNILGISGRCCHTFSQSQGYGKLGTTIQNTLKELGIAKEWYYVSNTCNRGPLLLHAEKLRELGYLDEVNYFLEDSDHDLFARAYIQRGWICGYVPIDVSAPLELGSMRKKRDAVNEAAYQFQMRTTKNGENGFLNWFRALLYDRPIEKRALKSS